MSAEITVIMPSYNVSSYIRECLDSVVNQTFKDLEILCIDAGSTDGTLEILREYERSDPRVRLILSEQKSYGYQINLGIRSAQGKYIGIVETDDYIEPDMYEYLYGSIQNTELGFAKGGTVFCYNVAPQLTIQEGLREFPVERYSSENSSVFVDSDLEPEILWHDFHLWNGLYRRDILEDIRLSETAGAAYQDTGFLVQLYTKGVKGVFSDHPVYHYRQMNYGASAYNPRAISFLRYEYDRIAVEFPDWDDKWKRAVMIKLFYQLNVKLKMMGLQGRYWADAKEDMDRLQSMIRLAVDKGYLKTGDFPEHVQEKAEAFLQAPELLYQQYDEYWKEQKVKRDKLLSFGENAPLVVFGGGKIGRYVLGLLLKKGIRPEAFCDNSEDMQGASIAGIPVVSVQAVCRMYPEAAFVIAIGPRNRDAARDQLLEEGIPEAHMMVYQYTWTDRDLLLLQ